MPYVSNGQVLDSRSPYRLSIVVDVFWGTVEFISLFFQTMIQPLRPSFGRSSHSTDSRGAPGPPSGRRQMGRIGGSGGPSAPPMAGG